MDKIKEVPGLMFVADSMEFMSSAGRRRMLEQQWLTNHDDLYREQALVKAIELAMLDSENSKDVNILRHQLMQLHDIRSTLISLKNHVILDEVELFEIKNLAYLCNNSRQALANMLLSEKFPIPDISAVFQLLDPDSTGVPNFYLYDSYDSRLAPFRGPFKSAQEEKMGLML